MQKIRYMGRNKTIFWSISGIFILVLWIFQYHILKNIPLWDDFHGIMVPVHNLFSTKNLSERLAEFVSLNNEHRIVNDRIFMLFIYLLTGSFNMKMLCLIGFINLIVICKLFIKIAQDKVSNYLYLLPVTLLIFQAQYFESLQYLMVPFQNFSVICYSLLCFYFLIYTRKYSFYFALLFGIMAVFSHGNGFLALIMGALILIFQLKKKYSLIWISITLFIISIYFIGYQKPKWSNEFSFVNNPIIAFKYMFEFWGSYILNLTDLSTNLTTNKLNKTISFIFGIILIITLILFFIKKYPIYSYERNIYFLKLRNNKFDLFLLASIGFCIATGILIGISRAGFPMVSRYTINSAILISLIYLLILTNIKSKKKFAFVISIICFLIVGISYYNNYERAYFNKKNVITDGLNWRKSGTWVNQYAELYHVKQVNPLLTKIYESKKYKFPKTELENYITLKITKKVKIDKIYFEGDYLQIYDSDSTFVSKEVNENGIYYELKSNAKSFIFPAYHKKNRIDKFIITGSYFSKNYTSGFPYHLIPVDDYSIFKVINNDGNLSKYSTNIVLSKTKTIKEI